MKLKSFILLISALVTSVIMGFFYLRANSMLGGSFAEMEQLHVKSVKEYTAAVLEGRKYLLSTYSEEINRSNSLSRLFLMADESSSRTKLLSELKAVKQRTQCDVADVISISRANSVGGWAGPFEKNLITQVVRGASIVRVETRKDNVWLVSYFPLRLFRDVVGVGVLGYELNGRLSKEISKATNAEVHFVPELKGESKKQAQIRLGNHSEAQVAVLEIKTSFVAALNSGTTGPILLSGLLSLIAVILVLYSVLNQGFVKGFRSVLSEIDLAASDLEKNSIRVPEARKFPIEEVSTLSAAFAKFSESTRQFHERVQAKTRTEAMGEKAAQLAHDLKGPIEALSMALDLEDLRGIPQGRRESIQAVLERIRKIASTVKGESKEKRNGTPLVTEEGTTVEDLSKLIDSIVAEKSIQYGELQRITLLVEPPVGGESLFVKVERAEFQRVLSNLIDNAVQAIAHIGNVTVRFSGDGRTVRIDVIDDGQGIPESISAKIGERGFSHGKECGSGLGVWHAQTALKKWNGSLEINSDEGFGTAVRLSLPLQPAPRWWMGELVVSEGSEVIVLDDDPSIHFLWDERFKTYKRQIQVTHFNSAEELVLWCVKRRKSEAPVQFVCDYELTGQPWTGLQVIEELGLEKSSVLCTGHAHEPEIRKQCEHLGVRLLSKSFLSAVPIRVLKSEKRKKVRTK